MMRIVSIFAIVVFLANGVIAQKTAKTMRKFVNKKLTEVAEYNPDGKLKSRETLVNDEPVMWFQEVNVYSNELLQKSGHYLNGLNIGDYEFFYNEKKQVERRRERLNDSVVGIFYYDYNEFGKLTSENGYLGKNKKLRIDYNYTAAGLVSQRTESMVDLDQSVTLSEEYEYNKAGYLVRVIGLNENDTLSDIRYSYDENGNMISQYVISHADTALVVQWKYKKGMCLPFLEQHIVDGFVVRQTKTKYNKAGLKKREKTTEYRVFTGKLKPEKTLKKYKYTWYDDAK